MKKQIIQLGIAACISGASFASTLYWWKSVVKNHANDTTEVAIAHVGKVSDEIKRRPARRVMWEVVNTGDPLFTGESIRTSQLGEVRIQFADGKYIDVEPDSLIILARANGEISLDLMEGSLFANAKGGTGAGSNIVLNTAKGKVELNGAAALSKGSNDSLNLQVLEGQASLKDKDGKEKVIEEGKSAAVGQLDAKFDLNQLQIISPAPGTPVYLNPETPRPVSFKWKGFPKEWKVTLHTGESRKEMFPVTKVEKSEFENIDANFKIGKHFWKLVATDANGKFMAESPAYRVEVLPRFAPTAIFPTADADLPVEKFPTALNFKWQKSEDSERVILDLFADPEGKNKIATKEFRSEEQFVFPDTQQGTFYWRLTSFYPGSDQPFASKLQKYTLHQIVKEPPKPPVEIAWTVPQGKDIQYYYEAPTLDLSWAPQNRKDEVTGYRLKLRSESETEDNAQQIEVKELAAKPVVPSPGRYIASVEALDKNGKVIGGSQPKTLTLNVYPLLPAPKLLGDGNIVAAGNGETDIRWENLEGAKEYMLTLSKGGKEIAQKKYTGTATNLKNLMPGEYEVKLLAIDNMGRNGEGFATKKLVVPDKSNLKAPTLKKIKVN